MVDDICDDVSDDDAHDDNLESVFLAVTDVVVPHHNIV